MSDNLAALAGATQTLADTTLGYLSTQEQKKANQQNYDIALKNLGLSEEQMKYMRELQERMFERDDNAITRMVKDLENNGFNKLLAFGTGGLSNTSVSMPSAPQMEYRYQPIDYSALKQNFVGIVADMENLKNIRMQRELMEAQKFGQSFSNILTLLKAEEDSYNLNYYRSRGLPTNASGYPKTFAEMFGSSSSKDKPTIKVGNSELETNEFGKFLHDKIQESVDALKDKVNNSKAGKFWDKTTENIRQSFSHFVSKDKVKEGFNNYMKKRHKM